MTALGIAARWVHLAASLALVGGPVLLLVAGRSDRPTARAWHARVVMCSRILALLAIVSALGTLAIQTVLLEGRSAAALDPGVLRTVAFDTQGGRVWLMRQGLLVLLLAWLWARRPLRSRADWLAARGETVLLAALVAALLGLVGHAAAVEPDTARAMINDAIHLLAAGVWLGGLWPLAVLLRSASTPSGSDARPYAVLAARRFSTCALASMIVLGASGMLNAALYVGDTAGLVGTPYGRWLLLKLLILAPILVLAWLNRRTLPSLSGEGETIGRPAMRRLAVFVTVEGMLALVLLVAVAVLVATPPARHEVPTWPFPFRFSTVVLDDASSLPGRVLLGSQLAVGGVVIGLCALIRRCLRALLLAGASGLLAVGLGLALPPLAIDAYPLTYRRPEVAYTAASISAGSQLYAEHCAACHGPTGAGDGLASFRLPRPPADLRAAHTMHHTAGDLYWWISEGIPAAGMPGFGARLTEEDRWDLVNFVRALAAAHAARRLDPTVGPDSPRIVAPDATFVVGPTPARSLRDYRGRNLVLLVLYTLPASRDRLSELAENYPTLMAQGVEVVAVPRDAAPDAIRRLGGVPPIWFPVVTEGAADLVTAYGLFAGEPHAEFLIDRQGYLRAISAGARSWPDLRALLAVVQYLNDEKAIAADPGEHVH